MSFDDALAFLIRDEGTRFTDDPKDSGGPTKYGVTQKAFSTYAKRQVTKEEIQNLTLDEAKLFYESEYWRPSGCDKMKDGAIATAIFDCAVLYGVMTSTIFAQQALNRVGYPVKIDGRMGAVTIAALDHVNRKFFLTSLQRVVLRRIDTLVAEASKNERFRGGWTARAVRLMTLA